MQRFPISSRRLPLAALALLSLAVSPVGAQGSAAPAGPAAQAGPGPAASMAATTGDHQLGTTTGCVPGWLPTFGVLHGPSFTEGFWALAVFDDGSGGGPELYVGGQFGAIGGVAASNIAKWDGSNWSPLGLGLNGGVRTLAVLDDGTGGGPALFAGGDFTSRIAKWNGTTWSSIGEMNSTVYAIEVFDDGSGAGPALYAAGGFTNVDGAFASRIASWDGSTWSPVGLGMNNTVFSLEVFDDGTGPALYAGGSFTTAGGSSANHIARWNGSSWSALGSGMQSAFFPPRVNALTVFDDGVGPALHAAGTFDTAGGASAYSIARWDGSAWSALGSGLGGSAQALAVLDDGSGSGPALYAGGNFTTGNGAASYVAKWDGGTWSALGDGVNNWVLALVAFEGSGADPALFVGGGFTSSPAGDTGLAKWGCSPPVVAYCFGDGSGAECPCGNPGAPGAGCGNSSGSGAVLAASGSSDVVLDDLVLEGSGLPPAVPVLAFAGLNAVAGGAGAPFGDGLRCVWGGIQRLDVRVSDAQGQASWGPALAGLHGWMPGDVRRFQSWYRDPAFFGCEGFNLSNGLEVRFH